MGPLDKILESENNEIFDENNVERSSSAGCDTHHILKDHNESKISALESENNEIFDENNAERSLSPGCDTHNILKDHKESTTSALEKENIMNRPVSERLLKIVNSEIRRRILKR